VSATAEANFIVAKVSATVSVTAGGGESESNTNSRTQETMRGTTNTQTESTSNTQTESTGSSESFQVNNGKSSTATNSRSSGSSDDNRVSDSIAVSRAYAQTLNSAQSKTNSSSDTIGQTYSVNDQYTSDESSAITNNINDETSKASSSNVEMTNQTTYTVSVSSRQGYFVEPGGCKILVCFPFVISVAVPYVCVGGGGGGGVGQRTKIVHTEMILIDSSSLLKGNLTCGQSLINCEEKNKADLFLINNREFVRASHRNDQTSNAHLYYGMRYVCTNL
jgi:hypothetical protein